MTPLTFEDFTPGHFGTFGPRHVTREEILAFALEFDPQPMHLDEVAAKGQQLHAVLDQLAARHEIIGDVRGLGLFAGVEFVADRVSREPFGEQADLTRRIVRGALERGVLILPGVPGANYGQGGDHIHISPPYVISAAEIDLVADVLDATLAEIEATL